MNSQIKPENISCPQSAEPVVAELGISDRLPNVIISSCAFWVFIEQERVWKSL